ETVPCVIAYLRMRVEEFVLEIAEGRLVQVKLPLQRPIRNALPLAQEGNGLIEEDITVHAVRSVPSPMRRGCQKANRQCHYCPHSGAAGLSPHHGELRSFPGRKAAD